MVTKILLIDDHNIILESLLLLFKSIENVEVVGALEDSRKACDFLENHPVDLVISDLSMPYFSGIDLTLKIRLNFPKIKILLLTMVEEAPLIREAIKAGANGYVLKKTNKLELRTAIETIMTGKKYFCQDVIQELTLHNDNDLNNNTPKTIHRLTEREIEILKMIALEFSSNAIGEKLFISLSTVETHRRNLFQKLDVKSAIGLAKYALKHNMID